MVACTYKGNLSMAGGGYPVKWFPGFRMADLLAKKTLVHDQSNIQALLDKPWYGLFKLINVQTQQVITADRCNQILPDIAQLQTIRGGDVSPYAEMSAMCVATESIANARPAQYSALSGFKLDANFPRQAPKNLAFITSSSEWQDIVQNKKIVSWAQVQAVKFESKKGEYQAKYTLVNGSGYQEVLLIARGDFNQDGIEDLLLFAKGRVVGGTYGSFRLFWITKIKANSPLTLIREYPTY